MNIFITKEIREESKIKLPIYIYYQDENCYDEYIKIDNKSYTSIKSTVHGYEINQYIHRSNITINERHLDNLTTEEEYTQHLEYAKNYISKL